MGNPLCKNPFLDNDPFHKNWEELQKLELNPEYHPRIQEGQIALEHEAVKARQAKAEPKGGRDQSQPLRKTLTLR
jgi:hypothetical protein